MGAGGTKRIMSQALKRILYTKRQIEVEDIGRKVWGRTN